MGAGAIPINIEKAFKERIKNKVKLNIFLADGSYAGADCLDVSFQGGNSVFTPPRNLIFEHKLGRISQEKFQKDYFKFLEESFIQHQYPWNKLLDSGRVVLVCSCNSGDKKCHRHVLSKFLKLFGAVYKGKIKK
jgi:hypothetical protein